MSSDDVLIDTGKASPGDDQVNHDEFYSACQTLKIIAEGGADIKECLGKDVAIFFGLPQTGKSTTINALIHGPLGKSKRVKNRVIHAPPLGTPPEKVAPMGSGMTGCTKGPKAYVIDDDLVILDTRGFEDNRDADEVVAATILIEIVLKHAKSIKLVFLQRIANFEDGLVGMQQSGQILGRVVTNDNISAMFLFNEPTTEYTITGEAKQTAVINELRSTWTEIEDLYETQWNQNFSKVLRRLRHTTPSERLHQLFKRYNDPDLIRKWKEMRDKIAKNLSKEEESHTSIIKKVNKAVQIVGGFFSGEDQALGELGEQLYADKEFNMIDSDSRYLRIMRSAFGDVETHIGFIDPTDKYSISTLINQLRHLPPVNVDHLRFLEYNKDVESFQRTVGIKINHFKQLMRAQLLLLKYNEPLVNSLLDQDNDKIQSYNKALKDLDENKDNRSVVNKFSEEIGDEISAAIQQSKKEIKEIDERYILLMKKIQAIYDAPYEKRSVNFLSEPDYHPVYQVVFNKCPFRSVEEVIGEGVTVVKGKDIVEVRNSGNYNVTYESGSEIRRFFRWFCNKVVVSVKLTLEVKPCDWPDNKLVIEEMQEELNGFKHERDELNRRLEELKNMRTSVVRNNILSFRSDASTRVQMLNDFQKFRTFVEDINKWLPKICGLSSEGGYSDILKLYNEYIDVIYDKKRDNRNILFEEFQEIYDIIRKDRIERVFKIHDVVLSDMNIRTLRQQLDSEFKVTDVDTPPDPEPTPEIKRNNLVKVFDPEGKPYFYNKFTYDTYESPEPLIPDNPPDVVPITSSPSVTVSQSVDDVTVSQSVDDVTVSQSVDDEPLPPNWELRPDGYYYNKITGEVTKIRPKAPKTDEPPKLESDEKIVVALDPEKMAEWKEFLRKAHVDDPDGTKATIFVQQNLVPTMEFNNEELKELGLLMGDRKNILNYIRSNSVISHDPPEPEPNPDPKHEDEDDDDEYDADELAYWNEFLKRCGVKEKDRNGSSKAVIFIKHELDIKLISEFNESDFQNIHFSYGDTKRIMKYLKKLSENPPEHECNPATDKPDVEDSVKDVKDEESVENDKKKDEKAE